MPIWMIERNCVRMGGVKDGVKKTGDMFPHYLAIQKDIWPDHHFHRWSDLLLRNFLENDITAVLGPKSSGKTHQAAKWAVTDYICFPEMTTILCSSTTVSSLELRVWGEIKKLWASAKKRLGIDMPGNLIDHKHVISTDNIKEDEVRDLRNGLLGIACKQGGKDVGIANYVGIKNKRVRMVADESQFMSQGFLEAISNLDANPDFKAAILGNPVDPLDQLGKAAEPINGWTSLPEPEKTETWQTRFKNARAVNLVGTDSPNFDFPQDEPPRYPELVSKEKIDNVISFWGKDSHQYYSQCKGVMKTGLMSRRVVTRELCARHKAFDVAHWRSDKRRKIAALDIAYGGIGGDRCVYIEGEFGESDDGETILLIHDPEIVPVSVAIVDVPPEDQIAQWVRSKLEGSGIHAIDCFYDSTGRSAIGSAFSRVFGYVVPVPVEFGGNPTPRPVRQDLFILDQRTLQRRHKRCDEHYRKFVTELWFSVRYAVEAEQVRGLTQDLVEEGASREWMEVSGNRIEIEPKSDTRERTGRSPDLFDALSTLVEGARQRGFKIQRLGANVHVENDDRNWLADLEANHYKMNKRTQLSYG